MWPPQPPALWYVEVGSAPNCLRWSRDTFFIIYFCTLVLFLLVEKVKVLKRGKKGVNQVTYTAAVKLGESGILAEKGRGSGEVGEGLCDRSTLPLRQFGLPIFSC